MTVSKDLIGQCINLLEFKPYSNKDHPDVLLEVIDARWDKPARPTSSVLPVPLSSASTSAITNGNVTSTASTAAADKKITRSSSPTNPVTTPRIVASETTDQKQESVDESLRSASDITVDGVAQIRAYVPSKGVRCPQPVLQVKSVKKAGVKYSLMLTDGAQSVSMVACLDLSKPTGLIGSHGNFLMGKYMHILQFQILQNRDLELLAAELINDEAGEAKPVETTAPTASLRQAMSTATATSIARRDPTTPHSTVHPAQATHITTTTTTTTTTRPLPKPNPSTPPVHAQNHSAPSNSPFVLDFHRPPTHPPPAPVDFPIARLHPEVGGVRLRARVISKSNITSYVRGSRFDLGLIDKAGDVITVKFWDHPQLQSFHNVFQVGRIYAIPLQYGDVRVTDDRYRNQDGALHLNFKKPEAVLKLKPETTDDASFPQSLALSVVSLASLPDLEPRKRIDVCAIVLHVSDCFEVGTNRSAKRTVQLIDSGRHKVDLALWRSMAEEYDHVALPVGSCVLIKHVEVSEYNGRSLSSCEATVIQTRPTDADFAGVKALQMWWSSNRGRADEMTNLTVRGKNAKVNLDNGILTCKQVSDLAAFPQRLPQQVAMRAMVVSIKCKDEPYYSACPRCVRKVQLTVPDQPGGPGECGQCGAVKASLIRFSAQAAVADHTGQLVLQLDDSMMHELIGVPASEFVKLCQARSSATKTTTTSTPTITDDSGDGTSGSSVSHNIMEDRLKETGRFHAFYFRVHVEQRRFADRDMVVFKAQVMQPVDYTVEYQRLIEEMGGEYAADADGMDMDVESNGDMDGSFPMQEDSTASLPTQDGSTPDDLTLSASMKRESDSDAVMQQVE